MSYKNLYPMKPLVFFLCMLCLALFSTCEHTIDVEKEEKAIIAVIEEETAAYVSRDYERMSKTYVHDEMNTRLFAGKNGYGYYSTWCIVGDSLRYWLNISWNGENVRFEKTNYKMKIYKESAIVIFDEKMEYDYKGNHYANVSIGVRFMEKVDKEWKIVYLGGVATSTYDDDDKRTEGNFIEEAVREVDAGL